MSVKTSESNLCLNVLICIQNFITKCFNYGQFTKLTVLFIASHFTICIYTIITYCHLIEFLCEFDQYNTFGSLSRIVYRIRILLSSKTKDLLPRTVTRR